MEMIKKARDYLFVYCELKKRLGQAGRDIEQLIGDPVNKERLEFVQGKIREWLGVCRKIEEIVDMLPAPEKTVIRHRYILCLGWDEVFGKAGYEPEAMKTIHERALLRIYESIK